MLSRECSILSGSRRSGSRLAKALLNPSQRSIWSQSVFAPASPPRNAFARIAKLRFRCRDIAQYADKMVQAKTNESASELPVEPEILELFRGWRTRASGEFVIESERPPKVTIISITGAKRFLPRYSVGFVRMVSRVTNPCTKCTNRTVRNQMQLFFHEIFRAIARNPRVGSPANWLRTLSESHFDPSERFSLCP